MKPEALQKWESTRARGMKHFVLFRGVLAYGLPMFVAMTFFAHHDELTPKFIAISAVLWLIGGAAFGIASWYVLELQYRKAMRKTVA
jgi:hypothetical protein